MDVLPKLSVALEIEQVRYQDRDLLVLSDGRGIAEESAYFPVELSALLEFFDGKTLMQDAISACVKQGIPPQVFETVFSALQAALLVDTPEVFLQVQAFVEEFKASPIRKPVHADKVYPAEPDALTELMDQMQQTAAPLVPPVQPHATSCLAVSLPHIDYQRGGRLYGLGLHLLASLKKPDVMFFLGTSHQPSRTQFQLTKKDFHCPTGNISTAKESVERIANRYGSERSFQEEFHHHKEHSLELQLPLWCHASWEQVTLVPVLVGSFHQYLTQQKVAAEFSEVSEFVEALAEEYQGLIQGGQHVLFYCGVDLSHMGQYFGDENPLDEATREKIDVDDQEFLQAVCAGSSERVFAHVAADLDRRRICGFPSLYVLLRMFETLGTPLKGEILAYEQVYDPQSDCFVSFANLSFTES